ncbi:hypothetical protein Bca52824_095748, partial [Brassica carinata]
VEKCIVVCTVEAIESEMGWYYLSCKVCSKKVQYERGFVFLTKLCIVFFFNRYKLHLVVLDHTGNSKFLLFDHLALQLVNQPCIELTGPITDV